MRLGTIPPYLSVGHLRCIPDSFDAGILVLIVILVFLQNLAGDAGPGHDRPGHHHRRLYRHGPLDFTVNLMTLFALILGIGIVVDDAIVIVENTSYHIERAAPKEATIKAMQEMTGPVMGITLVLPRSSCRRPFCPESPGRSSANSRWSSPQPPSSAPSMRLP